MTCQNGSDLTVGQQETGFDQAGAFSVHRWHDEMKNLLNHAARIEQLAIFVDVALATECEVGELGRHQRRADVGEAVHQMISHHTAEKWVIVAVRRDLTALGHVYLPFCEARSLAGTPSRIGAPPVERGIAGVPNTSESRSRLSRNATKRLLPYCDR